MPATLKRAHRDSHGNLPKQAFARQNRFAIKDDGLLRGNRPSTLGVSAVNGLTVHDEGTGQFVKTQSNSRARHKRLLYRLAKVVPRFRPTQPPPGRFTERHDRNSLLVSMMLVRCLPVGHCGQVGLQLVEGFRGSFQ